jgi:F-type H+-transporting ATPase subunit epsilon
MINFRIVTPEGVVYEDDIERVTIPTADGEITVLPNHTPIVSLLRYGEMTVKKKDHDVHFAVSRGIVEVMSGSKVTILADSADRAEEIDLAAAEEGRKRAEKILQEKEDIDEVEFSRFQALLDKEITRLRIGSKYLRK